MVPQRTVQAKSPWAHGTEEAGVGRKTDLVMRLVMGCEEEERNKVTPGPVRAHACMLMSFPSRKRWVNNKNIFLLMFFTL